MSENETKVTTGDARPFVPTGATGDPGSEEKKPSGKKEPRDWLYKPALNLVIASSPHDYHQGSVPNIMWNVVAALLPLAAAGIYLFGIPALIMILVCIFAAVLTEMAMNKIKKEGFTIKDGSAVITGLLLALTLPPTLSPVSGALGSIFAIIVGKQIYGGLGYNIFNPALLGRAFLQASFPVPMTTWIYPGTETYRGIDAVSAATPLGRFKFEHVMTDYYDLFIGNIGGSIGETSALLVLIGGGYLLLRRFADWRIPVSYIGTVALVDGIFWLVNPTKYPDPLFMVLSGGLMLGAFFMATDMVTSPITPLGSWIFGAGAGILLVMIRLFGGLPEGVMYSILLMNGLTPLINRYTRPKFFGEVRA